MTQDSQIVIFLKKRRNIMNNTLDHFLRLQLEKEGGIV